MSNSVPASDSKSRVADKQVPKKRRLRREEKGYVLHDRRLSFSSRKSNKKAQGIRTIKFELFSNVNRKKGAKKKPNLQKADEEKLKKLRNEVAHKIKDDHLKLYGVFNYPEFVHNRLNPIKISSFFDFWVAVLEVGGVFQPDKKDAIQLMHEVAIQGSLLEEFVTIFKRDLPESMKDFPFSWRGLLEFIKKEQRKTGSDLERKLNSIIEVDERELTTEQQEILTRLRHRFKEAFLDVRNNPELKLKLFIDNPSESLLNFFKVYETQARKDALTVIFVPSLAGEIQTGRLFSERLDIVLEKLRVFVTEHPIFHSVEGNKADHITEHIKRLLGLSDNCNAFSNFGGNFLPKIANGDVEELIHMYERQFHEQFQLDPSLRDETIRAIEKLARYFKGSDIKTNFAENIGSFRTEIESKLNSWLSNKIRLQKDLRDRISPNLSDAIKLSSQKNKRFSKNAGLLDGLENKVISFLDYILQEENLEELHESCSQIKHLTEETIRILKSLVRDIDVAPDASLRALVVENLSHIKSALNLFLNKVRAWYYDEKLEKKELRIKLKNGKEIKITKSEDETSFSNVFEELVKPVPRIPSFVGEEKLKTYEKVLHSPHYIKHAMTILHEELEYLINLNIKRGHFDDLIEDSRLQKLLECYRIYQDYINGALRDSFWIRFNEIKKSEQIYQHPKARRKCPRVSEDRKPKISVREVSEWLMGILRAGLSDGFKELITKFRGKGREKGDSLLVLSIDAAKSIFAILCDKLPGEGCIFRHMDRSRFEVCSERDRLIKSKPFEKIITYLNVSGEDLDKSQYQRLINELLSNIKGFSAYLGRQEITENYTIQAINGQHMDLYVNIDPSSVSSKDTLEARFYAVFPKLKCETEAIQPLDCVYLWYKGNKKANRSAKKVSSKKIPANQISSMLVSSRYQTQFLRWALKPPKSKRCRAEVEGSFLIAEQTTPLHIDWDKELLLPCDNEATFRIFTAIPFQLTSVNTVNTKLRERQTLEQKGRYIGVDLGEYVMAFCVIEVENTEDERLKVKVIDKGIIRDEQQRKLADRVEELKERQRRGSFFTISTKVADIRESLVGSIRNRLHSLALKYKAKLSYEYQVSYFERAGNRIKKVYQSVKMADCPERGNTAQSSLAKNIWGINTQEIATSVSAGFTSQTCSKCGEAILDMESLGIEDKVQDALDALDANLEEGERRGVWILNVGTSDGLKKIRFFSESDRDGLLKSKDTRKLRYLKNRIDEFMRPPLEVYADLFKDLDRNGKQGYEIAKEFRGNSSLFVCPLCEHTSDADIQAAFNIALRAAYREWLDGKKGKTGRKGKTRETMHDIYRALTPEHPVINFDIKYFAYKDGAKESFIIR